MSHLRKIQSKCQPKNYQNHRKTLYQNSKHTVPKLKTIRTRTQNNKYQNSKQWVPKRIVPWPDSCFGYNIAYTLTFGWQIPPLNSKCAMNLTSVKQLILSQLQRSCQIWHIFSPKHFFLEIFLQHVHSKLISSSLSPVALVFPIMELFDSLLSLTIDFTLGLSCTS